MIILIGEKIFKFGKNTLEKDTDCLAKTEIKKLSSLNTMIKTLFTRFKNLSILEYIKNSITFEQYITSHRKLP